VPPLPLALASAMLHNVLGGGDGHGRAAGWQPT
jgi:hypothetical protein